MKYNFLASLTEANDTKNVSYNHQDGLICPVKVGLDNHITLGISDYSFTSKAVYTGSYQSGRIGHPDNWEEDQQPELDHLEIKAEFVIVKFTGASSEDYEVSFSGNTEAESVKDAFIQLSEEGEMEIQPENINASLKPSLINMAKRYLINNGCYDSAIVNKHRL